MTKIYILNNKADAYGFVTQLAAEKYNIAVSALKMVRNNHGKPYFENLPDFHFNISHSGELKVLAVSNNNNIGVDTEKLREIPLKIAKKFCEEERLYINQTDSLKRLLEIWTKKEAYLKYLGTGLSGGLNNFNTLKPNLPLKTVSFNEYLISVCGSDNFEIIDLR